MIPDDWRDVRHLEWTKPKEVQTKRGPRMMMRAEPDEKFWTIWRTEKEEMRAAGFGVNRDKQDNWEVTYWFSIDPAEIERRKEAIQASRKADSTIEIPSNPGLEYRGYQRGGIAYALQSFKAGKGCLIADEMGLGKTIQAIGLINLRTDIKRVLVCCPNSLKWNWHREFSRWLTRPLKINVMQAGGVWAAEYADITIINYDICARYEKHLKAIDWDLRITDEAHWLKNPDAARTKAVLAVKARHKLALTGTPLENRPRELWTTIHDLDPETWGEKDEFKFKRRYCAGAKDQHGRWDFDGASNLDELQERLRQTIMVRRLKKDVETEMPPKVYDVITLPSEGIQHLIEAEQAATVGHRAKRRELEAAAEIAKADSEEAYRAAVDELNAHDESLDIGEMARIRKELAIAKVPHTIEYVNQLLDSDPNVKVLVFGHHLEPISAMKAEWPTAAVITGETPVQKRQGEVDAFQNSPMCRVFIGNDAAKEGLTLTAGTWVVFHEGDWRPGNMQQKADRAHRIGQKSTVFVINIVYDGTLDATMIKRTVAKQKVIDSVLDKMTERDATSYANQKVSSERTKGAIDIQAETIGSEAAGMSREEIDRYHQGLKIIASMCDGARAEDGHGFNGLDTTIGKSLAARGYLTAKQGVIAKKLCNKYRRQLGWEKEGA